MNSINISWNAFATFCWKHPVPGPIWIRTQKWTSFSFLISYCHYAYRCTLLSYRNDEYSTIYENFIGNTYIIIKFIYCNSNVICLIRLKKCVINLDSQVLMMLVDQVSLIEFVVNLSRLRIFYLLEM